MIFKSGKKRQHHLRVITLTIALVLALSPVAFCISQHEEGAVTGQDYTPTVPVGIDKKDTPPQRQSLPNPNYYEVNPLSPIESNDLNVEQLKPSVIGIIKLDQAPDERELGDVIDNIFIRLSHNESTEMTEFMTYIIDGEYEELAELMRDHPEMMSSFIDTAESVSKEMFDASAIKKDTYEYMQSWIMTVKSMTRDLTGNDFGFGRRSASNNPLEPGEVVTGPSETSLSAQDLDPIFKPFKNRVVAVMSELGYATGSFGNLSAIVTPPPELLKDFSEKAREFILDTYNRARDNLREDILSDPLGKTAFAGEIATPTPSVAQNSDMIREMTVSEQYTAEQQKQRHVVASVYIGEDFIKTQKYLNPPQELHPYLKWLLYTRNLTPQMVDSYLETRAKVLEIYGQAKEGDRNIRYRGKVYGAFLPFMAEDPGNYELVEVVPQK